MFPNEKGKRLALPYSKKTIIYITQKKNLKKKEKKTDQHMKSDKRPCITYADLESLIKKIGNCKNYLEKSSTIKVGEHIT